MGPGALASTSTAPSGAFFLSGRREHMKAAVVFALLGVIASGGMLAAQAPVNAALARLLGNPLLAACVSFGIGFAALLAISALRGTWPAPDAVAAAPWWIWLGGLMGAFYVLVVIWAVPTLGVASTVAALVLGQLVAALCLDAVGAFGLPIQPVSWQRLLSLVLVLGGLVLSRAS